MLEMSYQFVLNIPADQSNRMHNFLLRTHAQLNLSHNGSDSRCFPRLSVPTMNQARTSRILSRPSSLQGLDCSPPGPHEPATEGYQLGGLNFTNEAKDLTKFAGSDYKSSIEEFVLYTSSIRLVYRNSSLFSTTRTRSRSKRRY